MKEQFAEQYLGVRQEEIRRREAEAAARRKAVEAGYDIHHSAEILQEFYLRRYAEVTR